MKIQCDFCHKAEASIFCAADEAALCVACDHRVHQANKLAGKHPRFSLLQPSSVREAPRCDVCQERRALLFCQEDRAILCRECDIPIHTANQHTGKHNRFLLTGVKLSGTACEGPREATAMETRKAVELASETDFLIGPAVSGDGGGTSSISDYLIKTLPGWHVEELLGSYYEPEPGSMCKMDDPYELPGKLAPTVDTPARIRRVPDQYGYEDQEADSVTIRQSWGDDLWAVPFMSMLGKRCRTGRQA